MKFIRFGDIKAFEQKRYKKCPDADQSPSRPPRQRGFFALPYAFYDRYYIICHPASEPHSPMSYLRDKCGRKLTNASEWELSATETERHWATGRLEPKATQKMTDNELLRSLGLPKQPVVRENRPSWVCAMKDSSRPPRLCANGSLDQDFECLLDASGDRIDARNFFYREWHPSDFCDPFAYEVCEPRDMCFDAFEFFGLRDRYDALPYESRTMEDCKRLTIAYLEKTRGIRLDRLFPWPVYPPFEDAWLTVFKKPHVFEYDGFLWHHLREFVPAGSIRAAYGTSWVYTSARDFGRALRHVQPKAYGKQRALHGPVRASRYGGPRCDSATFAREGMYEVFFDEDDIKGIT